MSFPNINLSSCNKIYYEDIHYDKHPWQFSPLSEQEESLLEESLLEEPLLEEPLFDRLTPPRGNFFDDENEKKKRLTSAVPVTVNQPAASSVALSILSSFNSENHYPWGENDGESLVYPNSSPKTHLDKVNPLELTVGAKRTSCKRKPILSEESTPEDLGKKRDLNNFLNRKSYTTTTTNLKTVLDQISKQNEALKSQFEQLKASRRLNNLISRKSYTRTTTKLKTVLDQISKQNKALKSQFGQLKASRRNDSYVNQPATSSVAHSTFGSSNSENHYLCGENDGESPVDPNSFPKTHLDTVNPLELTVGAKRTSCKRKPILSEESIELTQKKLEDKRNRRKEYLEKYRNKIKIKQRELIEENKELKDKVDRLSRENLFLKDQLLALTLPLKTGSL